MEFNEKLQELRKKRGMTQEELAQQIYVSRAAISKWESGRGYPNIDSLKELAKFFSVSIDELLSGDEVLSIAEEDQRQKASRACDLVFGLLDCSSAMFLVLPLFGQQAEGVIRGASLLALNGIGLGLRAAYFVLIICVVICGLLMLTLHSGAFWMRSKIKLSMSLHAAAVLLFIISRQPYAAGMLFIFLLIKGLMLIQWP